MRAFGEPRALGGPFAKLLNVGAGIWFVLMGLILFGRAGDRMALAIVSLIYPLIYLGLSAAVAVRRLGAP